MCKLGLWHRYTAVPYLLRTQHNPFELLPLTVVLNSLEFFLSKVLLIRFLSKLDRQNYSNQPTALTLPKRAGRGQVCFLFKMDSEIPVERVHIGRCKWNSVSDYLHGAYGTEKMFSGLFLRLIKKTFTGNLKLLQISRI